MNEDLEKIDENVHPEEVEQGQQYKEKLDYESSLNRQFNRILFYYSESPSKYTKAVDVFCMSLMSDMRKMALRKKTNLGIEELYKENGPGSCSPEIIKAYNDLFIYVNELLEGANIVFKKGGFQRSNF